MVEREGRKDRCCSHATLQMDVTNLYIPHTDYRPQINCYIKSKWQELWDSFPENKLYRVKPTVETVSNAVPRKRRDDLVLTRARIGHTYLTHSYLLHGDERPYCIPCDCAVTVSHILVDCCEYSHIRQKYRVKPTVETVSNAVPRKRRDDLVLTRARIGHTYLTHSYLLHGDERPYCIPCDCAVTVSHILVDCCEYSHIRQKYYTVPDLKTLFQQTDPYLILDFLKESDLYRTF
ncbi:hypothetical protein HOLleu_03168 [Holothuria leucospilota]|uniref:Uncharacterized protein n=1 Tax=Holothuria leucospilota TaxID=206669 RepID=A0A9Q1HLS0_HOLLE|nr:hypothetical protein HOLleu_03168 [Holothuria leucospilota]